MRQWLPFDELHDDERTIVIFADIVDGADVGMVERRDVPGFVDEPRSGDLLTGPLTQNLDRDGTLEHGVERTVDDPHRSGANFRVDTIVSQCLINHTVSLGGLSMEIRSDDTLGGLGIAYRATLQKRP